MRLVFDCSSGTEGDGVVGAFIRGTGEECRVATFVIGINIGIGATILCERSPSVLFLVAATMGRRSH